MHLDRPVMDEFLLKFHPSLQNDARDLIRFGASVRILRDQAQQEISNAQKIEESLFQSRLEKAQQNLDNSSSRLATAFHSNDAEHVKNETENLINLRGIYSTLLSDGNRILENVADLVPSAHLLREKVQQFRKILEQFETNFRSVNAGDAKVPWQISYIIETDPFSAGGGVVEFAGISIISIFILLVQ